MDWVPGSVCQGGGHFQGPVQCALVRAMAPGVGPQAGEDPLSNQLKRTSERTEHLHPL